jgi:dihydropyrimidine dehydrogenase (NAD+) subunit PreA
MHWGYRIVEGMIDGLSNYLDHKGMASVSELRGQTLGRLKSWQNLDLNYVIRASIDQEACIGCGICYIACNDGAHQAIGAERSGERTRVWIKDEACVGCNLCSLVCPVPGCITMEQQDTAEGPLTWNEYVEGSDTELIPRPKHGVTID